jgi:hypothetical protein
VIWCGKGQQFDDYHLSHRRGNLKSYMDNSLFTFSARNYLPNLIKFSHKILKRRHVCY